MDILIGIGIFAVAFILGGKYGWHLRERVAQRVVEAAMKHVEEHQDKSNMIPIVVEKHQESLFIYKKDTNEFLAQGSTMQELNDVLESRFPGKKFSCSEEHLAMIKRLS